MALDHVGVVARAGARIARSLRDDDDIRLSDMTGGDERTEVAGSATADEHTPGLGGEPEALLDEIRDRPAHGVSAARVIVVVSRLCHSEAAKASLICSSG